MKKNTNLTSYNNAKKKVIRKKELTDVSTANTKIKKEKLFITDLPSKLSEVFFFFNSNAEEGKAAKNSTIP